MKKFCLPKKSLVVRLVAIFVVRCRPLSSLPAAVRTVGLALECSSLSAAAAAVAAGYKSYSYVGCNCQHFVQDLVQTRAVEELVVDFTVFRGENPHEF